jgi:hypothetical protein
MFDNIYDAIDWARMQRFTLNCVLLQTKSGWFEYYPEFDPPSNLSGYPMQCFRPC